MSDGLETFEQTGAEALQVAVEKLAAAQRQILSDDARYRTIIENAVEAIITIDEEGLIESANPSALQMFEYRKAELIGKNVSILVPPSDADRHDEYIRAYLRSGDAKIIGVGRDVEAIRKSGELFPAHLSISESEFNGRRFFSGIVHDLTDRRRYEESVQLISAIVESSNDAIVSAGLDGRLTSWNGGAERLCGYCAAEMIGRRLSSIVPERLHRLLEECEANVRRGEWVRGVEMPWLRNDGSVLFVVVKMAPMRGVVGDVVGASIVARDMTEQKRSEMELEDRARRMESLNEELQRRRDEAETHRRELEKTNERLVAAMRAAQSAAEAKTQFLANMSHEIRTPMTAILGYVSVLTESSSATDAERVEAIESIQRNSARLLGLIDDILDFAKLESGQLELERSRFSPRAFVESMIEPMRERAARKGVDLELKCVGATPASIHTSETRLGQILHHLIDNALKFTEIGRVIVEVRPAERNGQPFVEFRVTDTGVGVDPEKASELFEPFSQADSSMSRPFGGTGLGLSVCARLVKLLGGEIGVAARAGPGSEFWFTIPVECASSETTPTPAGVRQPASVVGHDAARVVDLNGRRILLVEDGLDNQRLISRFLAKAGADVEIASNGAEAVDMMMSARERDKLPDVVLMDMQMPVLDGYQATRKLRESAFRVPIIALTAHAMSHDRARCLGAGCDDYIAKPVGREALVSLVRSWADKPVPSHREPAPAAASE
ncbi:MAG TPA: PAS domain S-box protein [Phycisphaerae bacterium]|nr:PAS domain S-box protein [Phycisphaerae bacterium]HRW54195.1 PAS domain S-box protein [Phycisphaerae bacterium]